MKKGKGYESREGQGEQAGREREDRREENGIKEGRAGNEGSTGEGQGKERRRTGKKWRERQRENEGKKKE